MLTVALFLEDIAHERFLKSLIERVSDESGVAVEVTVLNASGGAPRRDEEFERFLQDYNRGNAPHFGIVVVARDTDCRGLQTVERELSRRVDAAGYSGRVVFAIPEPHIECWYMADPNALQRVLRSPILSSIPDSRCGRGRFKQQLTDAIRAVGVTPVLGGIEYANLIVAEMELYQAGVNVPSLGRFIEELRTALRAS